MLEPDLAGQPLHLGHCLANHLGAFALAARQVIRAIGSLQATKQRGKPLELLGHLCPLWMG